jgi:hypothetical protein
MPHFQMVDCQRFGMSMDVPRGAVREAVPEAFHLMTLAYGTASVRAYLYECYRIVNDTTVLGPGRLFYTFADVWPKDETWTQQGITNWYLFDVATDNAALAAYLNARLLLPTVDANIKASKTSATPNHYIEHRRVDAEGWFASFDVPYHPPNIIQNTTHESHFWHGTGPYHRTTYHMASLYVGAPVGDFIIQGDCILCKLVPGGVTAYWIGGHHVQTAELFQYDGLWI